MKVLLFTHEQDIDGMGNVILAEQAFEQLVYVPCKTFEITDKVQEYYESGEIYDYDFVYVTDLCIKEPLLSQIDRDEKLKKKFLVIDHHKSEIDEGNDKYSFVQITVENEKGKASGTSLFYTYLISQGYLQSTTTLDELAELTRQYDTWEWKTIYHNEKARQLHILFEVLGYVKYLEIVRRMVSEGKGIVFQEDEQHIIEDFDKKFYADIEKILSAMKVYTLVLNGVHYKIGYVFCPYRYRNDINAFVIKDNRHNVDLVGMIMTDMDTVSYRLVKDVDASLVAVYFGGKGHKAASSNPQNNAKFQEVLHELGWS